jgi:hypothetical protein
MYYPAIYPARIHNPEMLYQHNVYPEMYILIENAQPGMRMLPKNP